MTPQDRIKEAQEMYKLYIEAEKTVLKGQSYNIGGQSLSRANLSEIVKARKEWKAILDNLSSTGGGRQRIKRIIPMDD